MGSPALAPETSPAFPGAAVGVGPVLIIGAGPAGLTAAYELIQRGVATTVVDQDQRVGGLAQTISYKGYKFDIGGHRFFTNVRVVQHLWRMMLGPELLTRPRLSRVYYRGRFFPYPLKAADTLRNLGWGLSAAVLFSYLRARLFPVRPETSFEDWVTNRFGRRLFRIFFKSYTEKVWGIPCREISALWAAQRIKGLSLRAALVNMILGERSSNAGDRIKTLIGEFEYPRLGPGMMWEAFQNRIETAGGRIELGSRVVSLIRDGARIAQVVVEREGKLETHGADHVIATMPIRDLVRSLRPSPPPEIVEAADALKYRDFVTVALIVRQRDVFPDNWIYVHDPSVQVGRIQNFKNWSADMVPDPDTTCLGLEYFCSEGDALWSLPDDQFLDLAARELASIGLVLLDRIVDGRVVRVRKAYPVYDLGYAEALGVVRRHLETIGNLQLVGRNGLHKYNNQDHSMLTAILAVRNLCGEQHDLWAVNAEEEYHEAFHEPEPASSGDSSLAVRRHQPLVPTRIARGSPPDR